MYLARLAADVTLEALPSGSGNWRSRRTKSRKHPQTQPRLFAFFWHVRPSAASTKLIRRYNLLDVSYSADCLNWSPKTRQSNWQEQTKHYPGRPQTCVSFVLLPPFFVGMDGDGAATPWREGL